MYITTYIQDCYCYDYDIKKTSINGINRYNIGK